MDFFRAQHDARRRTRLLTVLFILSLLSLLAMTNVLLYFIFNISMPEQTTAAPDFMFYILVSAAVLLIVLVSSLFKALSLRQGGDAVAQMLNARLLAAPSTNAEQRLLNVVEEMAIASGTPVPPVYVMEETSINAFAAGHSTNDAVIGITRGAIEKLNRDELQGVIAHEFSHILHGDMRLNLRLIGLLHGIMVLGIMGHYILRAASVSRSSQRNNNNSAGIAVFGLGLLLLGASGSFFGGLIKAAVSRQREYLADASAVQYTRNPQGIAGALKRIAVDTDSPVLNNPASSQISHALFSEGVHLRFSSLFATHPPLDKRIRVLDPQWNGEYQSRVLDTDADSTPTPADIPHKLASVAVAMAIARAGAPDEVDISEARTIHNSIPAACADAAHSPLGAAAVICLLLMQEELLQLLGAQQPIRKEPPGKQPLSKELQGREQLATNRQSAASDTTEHLLSLRLPADANAALAAEIRRILPDVVKVEPGYRLALVNICLGSLRQLSVEQYRFYRKVLASIIDSDTSPDLGSWVLFQLVVHHLDRANGLNSSMQRSNQTRLAQSVEALEVFFSVLSYCGHEHANYPDHEEQAESVFTEAVFTEAAFTESAFTESAFKSAADTMKLPALKLLPAADLSLEKFQQATEELIRLATEDKQLLINAMSACVYHDQKLTVLENELMKMTSEMLDWPLPAKILR